MVTLKRCFLAVKNSGDTVTGSPVYGWDDHVDHRTTKNRLMGPLDGFCCNYPIETRPNLRENTSKISNPLW